MLTFNDQSCLIVGSRTCAFFLHVILDHLQDTKMWEIDQNQCKKILTLALKDLIDVNIINQDNMKFMMTRRPKKIFFVSDFHPLIWEYIGGGAYLNYAHFVNQFDTEKYIMNKMNNVYWAYVDKNIANSIKYRKKKTQHGNKLTKLSKAIQNVTEIKNVSELLFFRYRMALEPYYFLHCILTGMEPVMRVRYAICEKRKHCTFGENCRGGHVFLICKMKSENRECNLCHCMCNKHVKELQSKEKLQFKKHI